MNIIALVGKIIELPILKETNNGNKYATMVLSVYRPFKNSNGEYEADEFSVTLWRGISEMATEICSIGDVVSIKGRMQTYVYENKEGIQYRNYEIIAENLEFINKNN